MNTKLLPMFAILAGTAVTVVGCSDSKDSGAQNGGEGPGPGPGPGTPGAKKIYALSTVILGDEGNTAYLSLLDSLDVQAAPDPAKSIELSGWGDIWAHEGSLFVSDGEAPTITKYKVTDSLELVKEQTISFAGKGVTDAAFWANTFVSPTKAYMLNATKEYVVWNPQTMEIVDTIPLPAIEAKEGFIVRSGTVDRSNVIRDGKLYHPFYWSDDEYVRFAPDSKIAVVDIATNKVEGMIDVPCAGLDVGSKDEVGNLYFSQWTASVVQPLMKETPANCVAKIPAGGNAASVAFRYADLAGGREGAAVWFDGVNRMLFPVFHNERATYTDADSLLTALGEPNWRLWSYDRVTNTAAAVESVEWNSGAVYVLPVGGKTHLLIPGQGYKTTKVVRLEGATATTLFETRGWGIRLFQVR